MILRGGYNIYPRELEEVIMTHEAVSLVAVIGVPDDRMGEEVKAFVVKKADAEISEEEFLNWCKIQFANYKYPRYVEFRDELPVGGTGKIFKRALREAIDKSQRVIFRRDGGSGRNAGNRDGFRRRRKIKRSICRNQRKVSAVKRTLALVRG
jgi:acyl-CoA synthetase (AMP-forming)/AMP-acid ligase II